MRTLKKTLCFVLALVMVLGMGAFGVYAESTTSASTGDYTEASKVTEAIGVFIGGDGTDWSTPLTRAQAATLLCRLDGKTDDEINAMTISNTFTDLDPWAEPFVAYAEREGLILGVGGGRFDPQGALTGYQWALMLLRALGYTDAGEGINSDNWQVITARLSRQAGLDKNIEDMSAQLSREEGAQMVYNALKADMVEYNNGVTVTTDGSTSVNVSGSRKERTTSAKWGSDIDNKTDSNGKYIIQLGESLFKGDLKLADDDRDDFGRPNCDTWKYKGKEIVTLAASDEHLIATHTGKVEYKDLYADLGDTVVNSLKRSEYNYWSYVEAYIDGKLITSTHENALVANNLTRSNGDAILGTDKGSYTEVYSEYNSEYKAYIVTIVVINTYLAKASGNYNSGKGELIISTDTHPADGSLDSYKLSSDDIAGLDGFSDKDYLLYTCALVKDGDNTTSKYEVKSVYAPTILENVKVSSFKLTSSGAADNVTVDGSTYKYSKWASKDSTFQALSTSFETTGDYTYDIYLDENDFVVFAEGHSASGRYVYVESTDYKADFGGKEVTVKAKIVNLEGVKSTVTISKVGNIKTRDFTQDMADALNDNWFRYNVDTDGEYRLTVLEPARTSNENAKVTVNYAGVSSFDKKSASFKAKNGTTLYFDNSTMFVVYDSDSDVYHAYTGVTNLPDVDFVETASAVVKSNNHVSYMYISAGNVVDSGNVKWAFIRSTAIVESSNTNGKTTYTYDAVVADENGTTSNSTITLADQITDGAGLYYWYTTKDGMPNKLTRVEADGVAGNRFGYYDVLSSAKKISYDNGTVSCGTKAWTVNNNAQSWRVKDSTTRPLTGGDADKLGVDTIVNHEYNNSFKGEIFIVYKSSNDQTITEIYFMGPVSSSSSGTSAETETYKIDAEKKEITLYVLDGMVDTDNDGKPDAAGNVAANIQTAASKIMTTAGGWGTATVGALTAPAASAKGSCGVMTVMNGTIESATYTVYTVWKYSVWVDDTREEYVLHGEASTLTRGDLAGEGTGVVYATNGAVQTAGWTDDGTTVVPATATAAYNTYASLVGDATPLKAAGTDATVVYKTGYVKVTLTGGTDGYTLANTEGTLSKAPGALSAGKFYRIGIGATPAEVDDEDVETATAAPNVSLTAAQTADDVTLVEVFKVTIGAGDEIDTNADVNFKLNAITGTAYSSWDGKYTVTVTATAKTDATPTAVANVATVTCAAATIGDATRVFGGTLPETNVTYTSAKFSVAAGGAQTTGQTAEYDIELTITGAATVTLA